MKTRLLSMQQLLALLVVAVGISVLATLVGQMHETRALYNELQVLEDRKAAIQADIDDLRAQLEATQKPDWAELAVRQALHWTRPDETLIVFRSADTVAPAPQSQPDSFMQSVTSHWEEWRAYLLGVNP